MMKSAVERRKELERQFPIWERKTLGTHFADQTEKYPERSFLITAEKEWTYQDVWEESVRTAKAMMALGVKKREHIALLLENTPEFMSLKIAISLIGAVCIPINTMLREEELEYILQQSDSMWLFFHEVIKKTNHAESIVRLLDKEKLQDAHGNRQIQQAVCIPNDSTSSIDGKLMTWETFLAGSASIAEDAKEPYRNNVICKGGKVWQKLIRENEESTILIEKFP